MPCNNLKCNCTNCASDKCACNGAKKCSSTPESESCCCNN